MTHDGMVALLRSNDCCLNCLRPGHYVKECKSLHCCKHCRRPHHSLRVNGEALDTKSSKQNDSQSEPSVKPSLHASIKIQSQLLLITCQVLIDSPQGATKTRALLDSGSSASFISERVCASIILHRM